MRNIGKFLPIRTARAKCYTGYAYNCYSLQIILRICSWLTIFLGFLQARFINDLIPTLPLDGRGKNKVPKWMKKHMRPKCVADERNCLPPDVPHPKTSVVELSKDGPVLMYDSIELALRMEAAFWLERQFCWVQKGGTRHWYHHSIPQMIQLLRQHAAGVADPTPFNPFA